MSLNAEQMKWPMENTEALNAFFGDPRGRNGRESSLWYSQQTDFWTPPYPIFYSDGNHTPLRRLRIHRKCIPIFDAAFKDVLQTLGQDYITKHRLDISGGTFCYRLERGGSRLSVHSWAIAIDMDPGHNPFPKKWVDGKGMIDQKFVAILEKHGFYWRGREGDIDAMHFQLARHR